MLMIWERLRDINFNKQKVVTSSTGEFGRTRGPICMAAI